VEWVSQWVIGKKLEHFFLGLKNEFFLFKRVDRGQKAKHDASFKLSTMHVLNV
jgi:hypothetical protein